MILLVNIPPVLAAKLSNYWWLGEVENYLSLLQECYNVKNLPQWLHWILLPIFTWFGNSVIETFSLSLSLSLSLSKIPIENSKLHQIQTIWNKICNNHIYLSMCSIWSLVSPKKSPSPRGFFYIVIFTNLGTKLKKIARITK